jgi:hypothetical protein
MAETCETQEGRFPFHPESGFIFLLGSFRPKKITKYLAVLTALPSAVKGQYQENTERMDTCLACALWAV